MQRRRPTNQAMTTMNLLLSPSSMAKQAPRRANIIFSYNSLLLIQIQLLLIICCCSISHVRFVCHAGWIDPDTPANAMSVVPLKIDAPAPNPDKKSKSNQHQQPIFSLVFSDEFNSPHRSFADGNDPRWTALDKNDYTNNAQHYYSSDNAHTDTNGHLIIKTEARDTFVVGFNDVQRKKERVTKHFKSAMLQTWNKFCFTGGIIEGEVSLPGRHDVGGLWPAFWLVGNLARHTYTGSSDHIWPWSSSVCNDKTARGAQLVNACTPVQHYGLHAGKGRGAPEIDIFEVKPGNTKAGIRPYLNMTVGEPFSSSSYQVAPARLPRPINGDYPAPGLWYDHLTLTGGVNTTMNIQYYGSVSHYADTSPDYLFDTLSYNRQLDDSHFGKFLKYRVEWELPDANGTEPTYGYIRWFLDEQFVYEVDGLGLHTSGTGGEISSEPMYIILNTAVSSDWGACRIFLHDWFCRAGLMYDTSIALYACIIENFALLHFLQDFHFNVHQCVPVKNSIVTETSTKRVDSPKDCVT